MRSAEGEAMTYSPPKQERRNSGQHPVISPPRPAESFFVSKELAGSNVSPSVLAAQLQRKRAGSSGASAASAASAVTDDFATACEDSPDASSNTLKKQQHENLSGKHIVVHTTTQQDNPEDSPKSRDMMSEPTNTTTTTPAAEEASFDVSQQAYEKVKGVWVWGKGVPLVGFAEGIAEGIASKVVGIVGTNLGEIDDQVKPRLSGFDKAVLNPAIAAVVGAVMTGVAKGDDFVRPIIASILATVGIKRLEEAKKEEEKPVPEVTPVD